MQNCIVKDLICNRNKAGKETILKLNEVSPNIIIFFMYANKCELLKFSHLGCSIKTMFADV